MRKGNVLKAPGSPAVKGISGKGRSAPIGEQVRPWSFIRVGGLMELIVVLCLGFAAAINRGPDRLGSVAAVLGFFTFAIWAGTIVVASVILGGRRFWRWWSGRASRARATWRGVGDEWIDGPVI